MHVPLHSSNTSSVEKVVSTLLYPLPSLSCWGVLFWLSHYRGILHCIATTPTLTLLPPPPPNPDKVP